MDELTALQQGIDYAQDIADHLDIPQPAIALQTAELGMRLREDRTNYEITELRSLLLEAADCHSEVCEGDDTCCECGHLRFAVALVAGALRFELTQALDRRFAHDRTRRPRLVEPPHEPGM